MVVQQKIIDTEWSFERRPVGQNVSLSEDLLKGLMSLRQMIVSHMEHSDCVEQVVVLISLFKKAVLRIFFNKKSTRIDAATGVKAYIFGISELNNILQSLIGFGELVNLAICF